MKTKSLKTALVFAGILSCLILSSFAPTKTLTNPPPPNKWEEYGKVQEYVWHNVCKPLNAGLKKKYGKASAAVFSRCPSGYQSDFVTKDDSVKTDRFVNGRIMFARGCSETYVCDFKVCVATGFAVVKSKGSREYYAVGDWIRMENGETKAANKTVIAKN